MKTKKANILPEVQTLVDSARALGEERIVIRQVLKIFFGFYVIATTAFLIYTLYIR